MTDSIEIPLDLLFDLIDDSICRATVAKHKGDDFIVNCCLETITEVKKIIDDSGHKFTYQDQLDALLDD